MKALPKSSSSREEQAMTRNLRYLAALISGAVLAVICVNLEGIVAAIPVPWLRSLGHEHRELAFLLLIAIGGLPLTISGWVGGWVLFRATNIVSTRLWLLIALPWVIYALIGPAEYIASNDHPDGLFTAGLFVSIASVPVGLWLASLPGRKHVRGTA